jgi:hypothetical protein
MGGGSPSISPTNPPPINKTGPEAAHARQSPAAHAANPPSRHIYKSLTIAVAFRRLLAFDRVWQHLIKVDGTFA